jgi:sugar phosphate isomerase/epimerase
MLTRRDFHRLALAGASAPLAFAKINSKIGGVQIGVQSYSFRDLPLDAAIKGMVEVGLGECELWQGHLEPKGDRETQRKWRTTVPMDFFREVRKKFDDAGVELYAYNYSFRPEFTDEEVARGFEMAKALGVSRITASSTVPMAKRIDPYAVKAQIYVGMHNHAVDKPGEFATPQSLLDALEGNSKYIAINLDIGHFVAANNDPVSFLKQHHARIVTLHIKDLKKNHGPNVPLGEGDTPIKEVLQLLKQNRYNIPANIEYEYKGGDTVAEVKKCFEYCKAALA